MSHTIYPKTEYTFLRIDPPSSGGAYAIVLYDIANTIELDVEMYTTPGYDFIETETEYWIFMP